MLKFSGITKIFKSDLIAQPFVALKDVSFQIPSGSMVGFLGANGAGKTTSLKIIMDFIRPDSGEVEFDARLGENRVDIFKKIGFLPERPYFYPNLTGEEFLEFMGSLSEMNRTQIHFQIKRWAPVFKIEYALKRPLKTYSKGMLQRTGFLATIIHEPDFIILDEPLSGLDPIGRKELKDVISEVHRQGKTVFFSSHIVPDIEEICDRVIFLKEGSLVYDGSVEKLLQSEKQAEYTIKFKMKNFKNIRIPHRNHLELPDDLHSVIIHESVKNTFLSELIALGVDISGIELNKPNLEEIFYHLKGH